MTNSRRSRILSNLPSLAQIRNERCRRDPLYWAQHWTKTENPHYAEQEREFAAPFPTKSYFRVLFDALAANRNADVPSIFIPKTREMVTSWSVIVYAAHRAQWHRAEVIIQTDSDDKATELVGYAECLYRHQPDWLKAMHPLKQEASTHEIEWANGGRVHGIPKGVNKIRLFHPTIYIMDEAAFLPEAEQCYNAAQPVAKQIIAVSSAGPGWFGDECSQ